MNLDIFTRMQDALDGVQATPAAEPVDDLLNPRPDETDFNGKMRWIARLTAAKRAADERLSAVKQKLAELEPWAVEAMAEEGVEKTTVGGFTFFPRKKFYCNKKADKDGVTMEIVCAALRDAGFGYMVKDGYAASSLTSKIKELKEQGLEIHPSLANVLNIGEVVELGAMKA